MNWFEIYDEEHNKSIYIQARSLPEAIEQSEHVDFSAVLDGQRVPTATVAERILDNDLLWGTALAILSPAILAALFLAWTATP